MGAVDVGVGHHDDLLVAQVVVAVALAGAAAERLHQVGKLHILRQLVLAGGLHVEDFAAERQDRLRGAVARLLGRAAGRVALDDEDFRALRLAVGAVGELARQAELPRRGLARNVLFLAAADALLGAVDHEVQELVGLCGLPASQWSNGSLIAFSTMRWASAVARRSLVWPWNSGSRMNTESMQPAPTMTSSLVIPAARLPWPARSAWLEAAQQRGAHAGLVGAAVRRRHGVAVGVEEAVGVGGPGHRPLRAAVLADLARHAAEDFGIDQRRVLERLGQIILQPFLEMERGLLRHVGAFDQLLGAGPADLDAAEQIGLRARHLEHALGLELRLGSENLRIGMEAHRGAAPVRRLAGVLQLALRLAALEHHPVELLAARDLDLHAVGQGVGDRDADAVQAARGLVDLGVELAAGVQRAHDHFERRLVLELRMRIDRDAAAVVGDGEEAVGLQLDLDEGGVAGQRLVHRVVDHLGKQVMQRLLVGAADVHAGPPAHRLQALQHLDVLGGVAGFARARSVGAARFRGGALRLLHAGEQVADGCGFLRIFRGFVDGLGHAFSVERRGGSESVMRRICHGKMHRLHPMVAGEYWRSKAVGIKELSPETFPLNRVSFAASRKFTRKNGRNTPSRSSTMFGCIRHGPRRSYSRCALPSRLPHFSALILASAALSWHRLSIISASDLNFWPIWVAGSIGAALGDWLSYWVGLKLENRVYHMWPLSQHPTIIPAGEAFIRKWGAGSRSSSAVSRGRCGPRCRWSRACSRCRTGASRSPPPTSAFSVWLRCRFDAGDAFQLDNDQMAGRAAMGG